MMTTLGFFNLSGWELIIILVLALLIFGKRLPEVGRNIGKGIVEFKKGLSGVDEEVKKATESSPPRQLPDSTTPQQEVSASSASSVPVGEKRPGA